MSAELPDLRVSLVQGETRWHDPDANRPYYGALIAPLHGLTDLVVLPETFTSGFSNEAIARAEGMDGPTVAWMRAQAAALDAAAVARRRVRGHHRASAAQAAPAPHPCAHLCATERSSPTPSRIASAGT